MFFHLEGHTVIHIKMAGLHAWVQVDGSQAITALPPVFLIFFFPKQSKTEPMGYCGHLFSRYSEWISGSNGGNEKIKELPFCSS